MTVAAHPTCLSIPAVKRNAWSRRARLTFVGLTARDCVFLGLQRDETNQSVDRWKGIQVIDRLARPL
jgi:hypothetical protein